MLFPRFLPDVQRRPDPDRLRGGAQVLPGPSSQTVPLRGERQETDGAGL